jgi:hypothetical protein
MPRSSYSLLPRLVPGLPCQLYLEDEDEVYRTIPSKISSNWIQLELMHPIVVVALKALVAPIVPMAIMDPVPLAVDVGRVSPMPPADPRRCCRLNFTVA